MENQDSQSTSGLPLLLQWKNRNHNLKSECHKEKNNIKFSIISKQSLPYLGHLNSHQNSFTKGFNKSKQKQNASFYLLPHKRVSVTEDDEIVEIQKWKKKRKLEKLRNKVNFQKHKLKLEYQNLKINAIIECATQQLIEKQNKMLNGMI